MLARECPLCLRISTSRPKKPRYGAPLSVVDYWADKFSLGRPGAGKVDGFAAGTFRLLPLAAIAVPKGRRFTAGRGVCSWCMVTIMAFAANLPAQRYACGVLASK